jgi:3-oxoacyl-[acyl-carrier protein] reductase
VAGDITTPEGRAAALAACPQVDILVNNAGGPPPGDFRDWERAQWIAALDANMLTPIELIKATVDGMARAASAASSTSPRARRRPSTCWACPTARAGPDRLRPVWRAPGAMASANVTINNLLPGAFDTDRLRRRWRPARPTAVPASTRWPPAGARPSWRGASAARRSSARSARCCAARRPAT